MRKYYDHYKEKIRGRFNEYWRRLFNHSNEHKMSEGAQQADKLMTTAHKDQWRKNSKHSK
jgi:hypothetical protein